MWSDILSEALSQQNPWRYIKIYIYVICQIRSTQWRWLVSICLKNFYCTVLIFQARRIIWIDPHCAGQFPLSITCFHSKMDALGKEDRQHQAHLFQQHGWDPRRWTNIFPNPKPPYFRPQIRHAVLKAKVWRWMFWSIVIDWCDFPTWSKKSLASPRNTLHDMLIKVPWSDLTLCQKIGPSESDKNSKLSHGSYCLVKLYWCFLSQWWF